MCEDSRSLLSSDSHLTLSNVKKWIPFITIIIIILISLGLNKTASDDNHQDTFLKKAFHLTKKLKSENVFSCDPSSSAALRNRVPICEILTKILNEVKGRALEFGSGTGAHLEYFAPRFPDGRSYPANVSLKSLKKQFSTPFQRFKRQSLVRHSKVNGSTSASIS